MLGERDPFIRRVPIQPVVGRSRSSSRGSGCCFPLIGTRLAMSVCYSTHNAREKSEDPYQQVSAAPAWQLLADLAALPQGFGIEACRNAALRERR